MTIARQRAEAFVPGGMAAQLEKIPLRSMFAPERWIGVKRRAEQKGVSAKMDEKDRQAHPLSDIFPMATDKELAEMAEDIGRRGLVEPIVLLDGMILDGRNRYKACLMAGKPPRFRKYAGTDPLGDVVSWNRHRRHLTPSQLAMATLAVEKLLEAQAKERQMATLKKGTEIPVRATLPEREKGKAVDQAAKLVGGVSGRLVQDAKFVQKASPKLAAEVAAGKLTVTAARNKLVAKAQESAEQAEPGATAPEKEKLSTPKEGKARGTYKAWLMFREEAGAVERSLAKMAALLVPRERKIAARDLCQKIAKAATAIADKISS